METLINAIMQTMRFWPQDVPARRLAAAESGQLQGVPFQAITPVAVYASQTFDKFIDG